MSDRRSSRRSRRRSTKGAMAVAAIVAVVLVAFMPRLPGQDGYRIRALLPSVSQLRIGSEVRIAGLRVGEVVGIGHGPGASAEVELSIDDVGRPVRRDASLVVKPRLVLEGNAYIDLRPGSSGSPELPDGHRLPRRQASITPQIDEVLGVFDLPTRGALFRGVDELGRGLGEHPGVSREARGAEGLNRAVRELGRAADDIGVVARAARGERPGDLPAGLRAVADVTGELGSRPRVLSELFRNAATVTSAFARSEREVAASVLAVDDLLRAADSQLVHIRGALGPLRSLAGSLTPVLRASPRPLRATSALLRQLDRLSRPGELPGALADLDPTIRRLPSMARRATVLARLLKPVTDCVTTNVAPALNMKVPDGRLSSGDPVYLELLHAAAGLASFSSAVDGNGGTTRLGITTSDQALNAVIPGVGRLVGRASGTTGMNPRWLGYGVNPPFRPDQQCDGQALPDLAARSAVAPAWLRRGRVR